MRNCAAVKDRSIFALKEMICVFVVFVVLKCRSKEVLSGCCRAKRLQNSHYSLFHGPNKNSEVSYACIIPFLKGSTNNLLHITFPSVRTDAQGQSLYIKVRSAT
ncbi:hypothetical protein XENOCAPTIV_016505 [Xenoophorus captivus]|uniref:Secreted protein n=1 Tax=Xenoophorus captivus TaxID=1517983 RepID=A0ABV0QS70_9TELE